MDRRERSPSLQSAVLAAFSGMQSEIYTSMPCIVQSFDENKRTIVAQPTTQAQAQNQDGTFRWVSLPVLPDVPVFFPEGGGVTLTFPIKPGDEALVVIANRCIDSWWQSGGIQVQADLRMHDLSDGFGFVGISSLPRVISAISTSRAQLRSNDGDAFIELDPDSHFVRVKTVGAIEFDADEDITLKSGTLIKMEAPAVLIEASATFDAKAPLISYFGNMTWVGYGGGAGSVGMSNMNFNWNNITLAATGGSLHHDGKNIGSTHNHGNVTNGPDNTAGPNP